MTLCPSSPLHPITWVGHFFLLMAFRAESWVQLEPSCQTEVPRHPFHSLAGPPEAPTWSSVQHPMLHTWPGPGHTSSSQGTIDWSLRGRSSVICFPFWVGTESFKPPSYRANSVHGPRCAAGCSHSHPAPPSPGPRRRPQRGQCSSPQPSQEDKPLSSPALCCPSASPFFIHHKSDLPALIAVARYVFKFLLRSFKKCGFIFVVINKVIHAHLHLFKGYKVHKSHKVKKAVFVGGFAVSPSRWLFLCRYSL